jgi:hypothetical protein
MRATDDDADYRGKADDREHSSYPERCSPSRSGSHNANCYIGGEPYGDECDNRSLSGHALD